MANQPTIVLRDEGETPLDICVRAFAVIYGRLPTEAEVAQMVDELRRRSDS